MSRQLRKSNGPGYVSLQPIQPTFWPSSIFGCSNYLNLGIKVVVILLLAGWLEDYDLSWWTPGPYWDYSDINIELAYPCFHELHPTEHMEL